MIQTSEAVAVGAIVRRGDHNELVTDITALMAQAQGAPVVPVAGEPILWDLRHWTAGFTFGTAPFTSKGYLRLKASGMPWGADGIDGRPVTLVPTNGADNTGAMTLVLNTPYLFPAMSAVTIQRIDLFIACAHFYAGSSGQFDKVELQVIKIAADGTETALGAAGVNATIQAATAGGYTTFERYVSANLGAGFAIAATERLGFRIQIWGRGVAGNWIIYCPQDLGPPSGASTRQLIPATVATFFA